MAVGGSRWQFSGGVPSRLAPPARCDRQQILAMADDARFALHFLRFKDAPYGGRRRAVPLPLQRSVMSPRKMSLNVTKCHCLGWPPSPKTNGIKNLRIITRMCKYGFRSAMAEFGGQAMIYLQFATRLRVSICAKTAARLRMRKHDPPLRESHSTTGSRASSCALTVKR
jgi:hypothetical protein